MAINFKDGVILGADSRTTTGAYIANRVTDKLTQVHDTIWCCRSGSAADTQAVADIVQYHLSSYGIANDEAPTTQTAAALFQEICYANKDGLRYEHAFILHNLYPRERRRLTCLTVPESSSRAGTRGTAGKSSRYPLEDLFTSNHTPSQDLARHTSTDIAMPIGRRA